MGRAQLALALALGCLALAASSGHSHYTHDPQWEYHYGLVRYEASTGIQYPLNNQVVGSQVVEQSDSWHYIKVHNEASGEQTLPVTYRMHLYHDGSSTPHSSKTGTTSLTLDAGEHETVGAELSKTLSVAVGNHSVNASADLRPDSGYGWTVAYGHTHAYTRDN
jgi:hypothetical protein